MNYLKIYESLVERGKNRLLETYTESHHIIPRCMGGSDESDNLVDLTPEEHYLAHQLLVKIYPKNKALINAAAMMIPSRPSNKMYGWLRRKLSERMSELQAGDGNSQYGTRWIHNVELEESKKIPVADSLPDGWTEGRVVRFDRLAIKVSKKEQQRLESEQKRQEKIDRYYNMMIYYRDNNISMRELSKKFGVGHNVYKTFERYFQTEYYDIVKFKKGNSNVAKGKYKEP